jgi:hypothetical protein
VIGDHDIGGEFFKCAYYYYYNKDLELKGQAPIDPDGIVTNMWISALKFAESAFNSCLNQHKTFKIFTRLLGPSRKPESRY